MEPTLLSRPNLKLVAAPVFPQDLFEELTLSVKGHVLRPTDAEFPERARTFNGKLKPSPRVLVSPFDARDVSEVVKFCRKHDLSPSVRAGGYGIAGWSVAGDVIIDMSMMKDIEIEHPRLVPEGSAEPDWTRIKDMTPLGSKGKNRAQSLSLSAVGAVAPAHSSVSDKPQPAHTNTTNGKRRRDDRSPSPEGELVGTSMGFAQYDGASQAVASFLNGPPLPPVPGDIPRQPPTHKPRLHSPKPDEEAGFDLPRRGARGGSGAVERPQEGPPPLNENARQISGDSTTSEDSSSRFSASHSASRGSSDATSVTTPPNDEKTSPPADGRPIPASTIGSGSTGLPAPGSQYSFAQTPRQIGTGIGDGVAAISPFDVSRLMSMSMSMPSGAGNAGVAAWNPMQGFTLSGPAGLSPFSTPPTMPPIGSMPMQAAAMPPISSMPTTMASSDQVVPSAPGMLGLSPAFVQAMRGHAGIASNPAPHMGATHHHAKPVHSHAYVTIGAGMRQKEVDTYTADHAFEGVNPVTGEREEKAVPYHVPMSAHPVGSAIMLLAGFGFISRLYGLSIDNLVEVEMVLADGRIVIVNADQDPDLWWAVRGAGPAFGIATRYKLRAFPVPVVFAGNLIYRFRRATAPSLIKHFRDCIKGAPRELYANVLLTAGPADKDSLVVIQMCYVGPKEKGMEYLQAISSWDGERCLLNEVNEKSFLKQQDSVAQVLRGKPGRQWFIRSSLITSLPDEVINKTVLQFADTPIGCTWIFELAGGAIGDFEDTCLPKEQREATWTVAALHQWDMGIDDPRCITAAEDWMKGTIAPVSVGGPFPTFLGRHEPPSRTMACYGKNWGRLAELKRRYDPDCFFKNNFWPLDQHGRPVEPLVNEPPSP